MIKELIKTLDGENGKLYAIHKNNRINIGEGLCAIEVYECSSDVKMLGDLRSYIRKSYYSTVNFEGLELTRSVDDDFLSNVSRFEIVCSVQKGSGIFERITFYNILLLELSNTFTDWIFDVEDKDGITKKLLNF